MITLTTEQAQQIEETLYSARQKNASPTMLHNALATIRAARAQEQAEQEPVAWGWVMDGEVNDCIGPTEHARCEGEYTVPLYAASVRTKDLTDAEIVEVMETWGTAFMNLNPDTAPDPDVYIARAVIAADREKNK